MTKNRLSLTIALTSIFVSVAVVLAVIFVPLYKGPGQSPNPTPTATATPEPVVNELDRIFEPSKVSQTFIDLPAASIKRLASYNNEKYVAAKFRMIYDGTETQTVNVGIRIKGTTTHSTLNNTWYRPSFKIKFDWAKGYETQTLFGKRTLTFNAFAQDNSRLHETYAYAAYRAMDVPAPRTGYTTITFEGAKKPKQPKRGLYLVLESQDDEFFAENFQDVTQHVYENNRELTEFDKSKVGGDVEVNTYFKVKEGWKATPNRDDLRAFVKAINTTGKTFWENLDLVADRNRLIMLFAVDNFTGNWDTYSGPLKNNHTFRSNTAGKFTFVPWGTDQSFGEHLFNDPGFRVRYPGYGLETKVHDDFFITVDKPYTAYPGSFLFAYSAGLRDMSKMKNYQISRGKIFVKCLNYAPCSTLYFQNLQKVTDWAKTTRLSEQMLATKTVIDRYLSAYQKAEALRTSKWTDKQIVRVEAALKRNCKFDEFGAVSTCKAIRG
jgi:spore coat protein CotH